MRHKGLTHHSATIAFIIFLVLEMWMTLISQSAAQSHYASIGLAVMATIEILGGLIQALWTVPWFAKLSAPTGQSNV